MGRPIPSVTSENLCDAYFEKAKDFAKQFAAHEGVVGVLLVGGVAKGYADHFSEIDLSIFLDKKTFDDWTYHGRAPFPQGDSKTQGWHVEFEYHCYEDDLKQEWSQFTKWDYSYAKILYDPRGLLKEMLNKKVIFTAKEKEHFIDQYFLLYGDYFCNIVVSSWLHRGDLLAAHNCLNIALNSLVKGLFLINNEFIPFEKWNLNFSYTLKWKPRNWEQRIEQAILIKEISRKEVERRQKLISELLSECKLKMLGRETGDLGTIEAKKLEILEYLYEHKRVKVQDFKNRFDLSWLLKSPLFYLIRWERLEKEYLIFDDKELKRLVTHNYEDLLEWDKQLLKKFVKSKVKF